LYLAEIALGIGRANECLAPLVAERVAIAGPVLAVSLLEESHLMDLLWTRRERAGSTRGANQGFSGVFNGLYGSTPVTGKTIPDLRF
jgi:hypothetical protein